MVSFDRRFSSVLHEKLDGLFNKRLFLYLNTRFVSNDSICERSSQKQAKHYIENGSLKKRVTEFKLTIYSDKRTTALPRICLYDGMNSEAVSKRQSNTTLIHGHTYSQLSTIYMNHFR